MKIEKFIIAFLLTGIMISSTPIVNATINKLSDITESDLQTMYKQYNVSENEVKFAKGQLPHYLDGTILNSDKKVVASSTGKPAPGDVHGRDYDILISQNEMLDIIQKARVEYLKKYGVDVSNTKIQMIGDKAIPKEAVKKLVDDEVIQYSKELEPAYANNNTILTDATTLATTPPYIISGTLIAKMWLAKDSAHKPIETFAPAAMAALNRFKTVNSALTTVNFYWYYNTWDASNIVPYDNAYGLIKDLKADIPAGSANVINIGYVQKANHNGIAYAPNSQYSVCALHPSVIAADWPEDSVTQHEVSHNFGLYEQGGGNHVWGCIMDYASAYAGVDTWCSGCKNYISGSMVS